MGFIESVMTLAAEVYEPDDAWGLVGLLIVGLPSTITAVASGLILWRTRKVQRGIDDTNSQVINDHEDAPPLRVDLDGKFSVLGTKIDGVTTTLLDHGNRLNSIEDHLRRG